MPRLVQFGSGFEGRGGEELSDGMLCGGNMRARVWFKVKGGRDGVY